MAIEVNKLTVHSSISDKEDEPKTDNKSEDDSLSDACTSTEDLKTDILAECQRLIKMNLREIRER